MNDQKKEKQGWPYLSQALANGLKQKINPNASVLILKKSKKFSLGISNSPYIT